VQNEASILHLVRACSREKHTVQPAVRKSKTAAKIFQLVLTPRLPKVSYSVLDKRNTFSCGGERKCAAKSLARLVALVKPLGRMGKRLGDFVSVDDEWPAIVRDHFPFEEGTVLKFGKRLDYFGRSRTVIQGVRDI
jgi:hypothetical protein